MLPFAVLCYNVDGAGPMLHKMVNDGVLAVWAADFVLLKWQMATFRGTEPVLHMLRNVGVSRGDARPKEGA